jgi:glc operon protein GlcG
MEAVLTRKILWFLFIACLTMSLAERAAAQLVEKKTVGLTAARKMVAAAEAEAAKNGWTMVVAVLDDGGNLVALERMDGTQLGSVDVAQAKALTALRFKRPTLAFQDRVNKGEPNVLSLGHITAVQGGLPIIVDGKVIGAIGASGGQSPQDEQCAKAGLAVLTEN